MKTLIGLLIALVLAGSPARAQQTTCVASGPYAAELLDRYRTIAGVTSPRADTLRNALGLVYAPAADVQIVTNESTCIAASSAIRSAVNRLDLPAGMTWVIQVGQSRYVVADPRLKSAIDVIHVVFDSSWHCMALISH